MTEQEITQARADVDQLGIEQLRCGVMLQLLKIEALTKERDELRLQIDIQAGSIEAAQAANQRLSANHKDCVKCLGESLQDRADLAAAAKLSLDALECIPLADSDCDVQTQREDDAVNEAIAALRQAGMQ